MSLITEQKRAELEAKSRKERAKLIKQKNPELDNEIVIMYARLSRSALAEDVFWEVSNQFSSTDEKAKNIEKSKSTVDAYRSSLLALDVINPLNVISGMYTVNDLEEAEQIFPTTNSLRRAINDLLKEGVFEDEYISKIQLADMLSVPRMKNASAIKYYGMEYRTYHKFGNLLRIEVEAGTIKK